MLVIYQVADIPVTRHIKQRHLTIAANAIRFEGHSASSLLSFFTQAFSCFVKVAISLPLNLDASGAYFVYRIVITSTPTLGVIPAESAQVHDFTNAEF